MRLIIIRHGETDSNKERRIQGQLDVPLNARGEEQAKETAAILHTKENVDAVFASDLSRAFRTGEIIAASANLTCIPFPLLRERSMGPVEGMLHKDALVKRKNDGFATLLCYGESEASLQSRVVKAYQELIGLAAAQNWKCIVIVSHGSALTNLFTALRRRKIVEFKTPEVQNRFFKRPKLGNCSVTIIEDGKFESFAEQWTDSIVRERSLV